MAGVAVGASADPAPEPMVAPPAGGPDAAVDPGGAPALGYRPALDGLRAVAVLAVMVEHSGVRRPGAAGPLLPGGFLGVDVFFVISGFLITSLLLLEHRRGGTIDLRRFWLRRARRLLPAAALAIAVTCLVAALVDLDVDGSSLRGDALAALGYVANWRFIATDQSYFAAFGLPSPFRHLWSLSLEEQWYLVFPLVLLGVLALVRRRTWALLAVLGAGAVASAVWMAVCSTPGTDPSRAYYGTDTRAHTLLVGAILAVVMVRMPGFGRRLARLAPAFGVVGLAALAVLFWSVGGQNDVLYDGGFLIIALASAAVVAGVALPGASGPVQWVLARRPFVAVGLLSYGLYLWHWPVFVVMTPDRVGLTGAELAAARIAVAFVVATVSYVLVEQPVRRHGLGGLAAKLRPTGLPLLRRPAGAGAALAVAAVAVVVVSTRTMAEEPGTEFTPVTVPRGAPAVTTTILPSPFVLPAVPADRPLKVMIGGDSVAWSLAYPWGTGESEIPDGIDTRMVASLGCTVTPGIPIVGGVDWPPTLCPDWPATWEAMAFGFQPDVVVAMWGAWEVYDHRLGDRMLVAGTTEYLDAMEEVLSDSVDRVAAVSPTTRLAFVTIPCMEERDDRLGGAESPRNDPANLALVNERTAAVVARHPGRTLLIDLGPLVCRDGRAIAEQDGVVTRHDGVHFSPEFGAVVWRYLDERMRPWLSAPATATTS